MRIKRTVNVYAIYQDTISAYFILMLVEFLIF